MMKHGSQISYKGTIGEPTLFVNVNKSGYRQFPYMDTFKHFDVQSATLCNKEYNHRGFNLGSTQGAFYPKGTTFQKNIDKATNFIRRFKDYI